MPRRSTSDASIHRETIPGGWYWTTRLNRGETLRIINTSGSSTVSLLAWNASDASERLNHADTIKVQWAAALQQGPRYCFPTWGACCSASSRIQAARMTRSLAVRRRRPTRAKYGEGPFRNTRDNFILAAGKLGLDRRDVHPCVSFFAPVAIDADGAFLWTEGRRQQGDFVDLRAEMDLFVALSNCPHPLDPAPTYAPGGGRRSCAIPRRRRRSRRFVPDGERGSGACFREQCRLFRQDQRKERDAD